MTTEYSSLQCNIHSSSYDIALLVLPYNSLAQLD